VGDSYTHTHMTVRCMAGVVVESGVRVCVCMCVCVCVWVGAGGGGVGGGNDWQRGRREFVPVMDTPRNETACSAPIRCRTESTCMGRTILPDHHLNRYLPPRGQAPPLLTTGS
jgi:hypothetical protein